MAAPDARRLILGRPNRRPRLPGTLFRPHTSPASTNRRPRALPHKHIRGLRTGASPPKACIPLQRLTALAILCLPTACATFASHYRIATAKTQELQFVSSKPNLFLFCTQSPIFRFSYSLLSSIPVISHYQVPFTKTFWAFIVLKRMVYFVVKLYKTVVWVLSFI